MKKDRKSEIIKEKLENENKSTNTGIIRFSKQITPLSLEEIEKRRKKAIKKIWTIFEKDDLQKREQEREKIKERSMEEERYKEEYE